MTTITNEEKISLIDGRIRNLIINKYSFELGLIEENSVQNPNQEAIASITEQINSLDLKIAALQNEKSALSE